MTIYSASSIAAVTISPEGHGGCGRTHSRPAPGGRPEKVWALDCPPCEDHLRHDPLWSATIEEIPETHDEKIARENFDKRGAKDKDAILTLALARLAGIDSSELPESLTRMITGVPGHIPGSLECPAGHVQPSGQKFCGECGAPMRGTPAERALPAAQPPPAEPAKAAQGPKRRLRDARLDELQALARERGVDESGPRPDLISRLSAAGVTSNDLAALTPVAA